MHGQSAERYFNLKLIPGVKDVASIMPLCLTGGAFAVYLQLAETDRKTIEKVKKVLLAAFVVDPYVAYEQFINRKLHLGELPDMYLADLRHLASLFSRITFVARLPDVRQLLRAGSQVEALDFESDFVTGEGSHQG